MGILTGHGGPFAASMLALLVTGGGGCVNRGMKAPSIDHGRTGIGSQLDSGGGTGGLVDAGDSDADDLDAGTGGAAGGAGGMSDAAGGAPGTGGAMAGTGGATAGAGGTAGGAGGATPDAGVADSGMGGAGGMTSGNDAGVLACVPGISPGNALLTDFSPPTWDAGLGQWGLPGNLTGKITTYGGGRTVNGTTTAISQSVTTTAANPALSMRGNVAATDYGGIALPFDQCVNTTLYGGVRFTLGGTTAGCALFLQLETYSRLPITAGGGCTGTCFGFPFAQIQIGAAPITVTFAGLAGSGLPATAAAMRAEIVGLQFQLQSPGALQPSCLGVNMTIDDLQFVAN
jgi:hypothetical protein